MLLSSLAAIRGARPGLTLVPSAIVEAVFLTEGGIGSAEEVAQRLGMRSRFALARLLKRVGLPPLHRLASWATVLSWVRASEREGVSLLYLAYHSNRQPSACYRLVKEVTGLRWEQLRARGSTWVQTRMEHEVLLGHRPSKHLG